MKNKPLIYNSDLKALQTKTNVTPEEYHLISLANALETKIQQSCHNMFNVLAQELEIKYGKKVMEFVQIDNGASLKPSGKIRKQKEGLKRGWPDVMLAIGSPCGQFSETIFIEFKRIGTPSNIIISLQQQYYHDWLNRTGFNAYITNNPLYFKEAILGKVREFFN
jgi:hypothetical protein